jgi:predicted aspartyl protease
MINIARARETDVGRFSVRIKVGNYVDREAAERGLLDAGSVREVELEGLVDCGASRLVLPASVVRQLGQQPSARVKVKYADGRTATRDSVEGVYVELQGRHGVFSATVEPKRENALIGAIVLEDLDFLIDPQQLRLVPRDPKFVVNEIE